MLKNFSQAPNGHGGSGVINVGPLWAGTDAPPCFGTQRTINGMWGSEGTSAFEST